MNNSILKNVEEILLNENKPSIKLNKLMIDGKFENTPLDVLCELKDTEQNIKFHPEGNVWNHVLMVVDKAAEVKEKSIDKRSFMMAALLHDIGKTKTTVKRNGKWTSYDHDIVGAEMVRHILREFNCEDGYIDRVVALVRYHMHSLYINNNLPFSNLKAMNKSIEPEEEALLCYCDRLGRGEMSLNEKEEIKKFIKSFYDAAINNLKM